jgi:RNA polymerase sigma-70 factor, ECF subfamily
LLTLARGVAFTIMSDPTQDDSDSSFVTQLTEHQLAMNLYVRSLLPGDPAVCDVLQQTNAKLWEKRKEFVPNTNFKAWAFSVARFEVLNHRKVQARNSKLIFSSNLEEVFASELANSELNFQERLVALRECLTKLKPQDRQLLMHRYSSSKGLEEFATQVGRSLGGLKVTLHRLRSALRVCMQRRLSQGDVSP